MFDVKEAPTRKGKCEVVWYAKKSMAEHAAAGKALDCMHFRDKVTPLPPQLCWEDPYEKGYGPPLPTNLPHDALEKLGIEAWMANVPEESREEPTPSPTPAPAPTHPPMQLSRSVEQSKLPPPGPPPPPQRFPPPPPPPPPRMMPPPAPPPPPYYPRPMYHHGRERPMYPPGRGNYPPGPYSRHPSNDRREQDSQGRRGSGDSSQNNNPHFTIDRRWHNHGW